MAAKFSPVGAPRGASGFRPKIVVNPLLVGGGGMSGTRFPSSARVLTSAEFERIFKHGKRTASPLLALHMLAQAEGGARLGLVVSRKVDKRAVGRNRIKRVVRDYFRRIRPQLQSGAYVVLARAAAKHADNAQLRQTLEHLFARAGVLQPSPSSPISLPTRV